MWQTKYALAVPKNLRAGVTFWLCSKQFRHLASVVGAMAHCPTLTVKYYSKY